MPRLPGPSCAGAKVDPCQGAARTSGKPTPGAEYLGRVTLFAAVSNKGFVCNAAVSSGVDSRIDQTIIKRFKSRKFPPVVEKGEAVPANVIVPIDVWRTPDKHIVEYPEPKLPKL